MRNNDEMRTSEELKRLSECDYIEIGAHTINHPRLANEEFKSQEYEIVNSKKQVEELTGKQVHSFSYPYGNVNDFDKNSVAIVKKAGYNCALSNIQDKVDGKTSLFTIPRRLVRNWSAVEFEQQLQTFFDRPINLFDVIKANLKVMRK